MPREWNRRNWTNRSVSPCPSYLLITSTIQIQHFVPPDMFYVLSYRQPGKIGVPYRIQISRQRLACLIFQVFVHDHWKFILGGRRSGPKKKHQTFFSLFSQVVVGIFNQRPRGFSLHRSVVISRPLAWNPPMGYFHGRDFFLLLILL